MFLSFNAKSFIGRLFTGVCVALFLLPPVVYAQEALQMATLSTKAWHLSKQQKSPAGTEKIYASTTQKEDTLVVGQWQKQSDLSVYPQMTVVSLKNHGANYMLKVLKQSDQEIVFEIRFIGDAQLKNTYKLTRVIRGRAFNHSVMVSSNSMTPEEALQLVNSAKLADN